MTSLGVTMANLRGFTAPSVGNMLNHFTRHAGDPDQEKYTYHNIRIDPSKTHLNYALFERENPAKFIREKIKEADTKPKNSTNVMSSWIITLPRNERLEGREREFFEVAYKHLCKKVGDENVIGAWVHMDETQPHMHFAFTPCIETQQTTNDKSRPLRWTAKDERKNPEHKAGEYKRDSKGTIRYERVPVLDESGKPIVKTTFSQAKMFNQSAMKKFHPELTKIMEKHFGFDVGIELSDPGDKVLSRLDQPDYIKAKKTKKKLESDTKSLADNLDDLRDKRDEIRRQVENEAARLERLQRERVAAEERVGIMESVSERCRAADAAPLGEKGGILGEIASACSRFIERVKALLPDGVIAAIDKLVSEAASLGPVMGIVHDDGEAYNPFAKDRYGSGSDDRQMQKEKVYVRSKSRNLPGI